MLMDWPQRHQRDDRCTVRVGNDPPMLLEGLISGTTSGTAVPMRKVEESSTPDARSHGCERTPAIGRRLDSEDPER
jgi:hypothetical protein